MIQVKERNSNSYNENKQFIQRRKMSTEDRTFFCYLDYSAFRERFCRYELAGLRSGMWSKGNTSSLEYTVKKG
jgi:hypothetical protein